MENELQTAKKEIELLRSAKLKFIELKKIGD
jgi:hypothetical protein